MDILVEELGIDPKNITETDKGYIIDGGVVLKKSNTIKKLRKIPFKFYKVFGNFDASFCLLGSLHNCPEFVEHDFICSMNNFQNLEHSPKEIGGDFVCVGNRNLNSIRGVTQKGIRNFICTGNKNLRSLTGFPSITLNILDCSDCSILSLDGLIGVNILDKLICSENKIIKIPESLKYGDIDYSNNPVSPNDLEKNWW